MGLFFNGWLPLGLHLGLSSTVSVHDCHMLSNFSPLSKSAELTVKLLLRRIKLKLCDYCAPGFRNLWQASKQLARTKTTYEDQGVFSWCEADFSPQSTYSPTRPHENINFRFEDKMLIKANQDKLCNHAVHN